MLVLPDHVSMIQTALLESRKRADEIILFHCSDGKIEVKSTFLTLHSKMLRQIILEIPLNQKEVSTEFLSPESQNKHTVLLLDVPKSHISHLMNIITFGNSEFSGVNKSEIESTTSEILKTAAYLDISISNYVLHPEDCGQLAQRAPSNSSGKKSISNLDKNFGEHETMKNAKKANVIKETQSPKLAKFPCVYSDCQDQFSTLSQLRRHQFSYHWRALVPYLHDPTEAEHCTLCHKQYPKNLIGAHMLIYHEKKKLAVPCSQCGDMFSKHNIFFRHMTSHINNGQIQTQPSHVNLNPSVDESISIPEPETPSFTLCNQIINQPFNQTVSKNALSQEASNLSSSTVQRTNPLPSSSKSVESSFLLKPPTLSSEALSDASTSKTIRLRSDLMNAPLIHPARLKIPATQILTPTFKFSLPAEPRIPKELHFSRTQSPEKTFEFPHPVKATIPKELHFSRTQSSENNTKHS